MVRAGLSRLIDAPVGWRRQHQKVLPAGELQAGQRCKNVGTSRPCLLWSGVGPYVRLYSNGEAGGPMASSSSNKDYSTKTRISMKDPEEIAYWRERFGVSRQALSGAIRATGSSGVKKIEAYLKSKGKCRA